MKPSHNPTKYPIHELPSCECRDWMPDHFNSWVSEAGQTCADFESNAIEMCTSDAALVEGYNLMATEACCACQGGSLCSETCSVMVVIDICDEIDAGTTTF